MRARAGQITLEYFVVFAAVVAVTLLALTAFDDNIRASLQEVVQTHAEEMAKDNSGVGPGGEQPPRVPFPCRKNPDHPSCNGL